LSARNRRVRRWSSTIRTAGESMEAMSGRASGALGFTPCNIAFREWAGKELPI
jgi:hypothetical protein